MILVIDGKRGTGKTSAAWKAYSQYKLEDIMVYDAFKNNSAKQYHTYYSGVDYNFFKDISKNKNCHILIDDFDEIVNQALNNTSVEYFSNDPNDIKESTKNDIINFLNTIIKNNLSKRYDVVITMDGHRLYSEASEIYDYLCKFNIFTLEPPEVPKWL
jgi:hypothetical protein